jgi:hypothetical protein
MRCRDWDWRGGEGEGHVAAEEGTVAGGAEVGTGTGASEWREGREDQSEHVTLLSSLMLRLHFDKKSREEPAVELPPHSSPQLAEAPDAAFAASGSTKETCSSSHGRGMPISNP